MNLETAKRLHDAREACRELQAICAGETRETYLSNRLLMLGVWKLVEIVGESLRQAEVIDPTLGQRIPNLRSIINTRHRIAHGYDSVNFNLLWDIVQYEIPSLELTVVSLIDEAPQLPDEGEQA